MTPKAFRALALSLPGAHEEPHFERASFRVGKKIFATLTADGAEAMVHLGEPEQARSLIAARGATFFGYGGWTERHGALGVRLSRVNAELLRELLVDAWRRVAPKRAQTLLR
jgi:hypothetical protein